MRILTSLLFLLILPSITSAEILAVPMLTPQKTPHIVIKKSVISPKKIQETRIQNTPSEIYGMIYKGKAIEVFSDTGSTVFIQKISLKDGGKIGNFFDFFGYDDATGEPLYTRFSPKEKLRTLPSIPTTVINGQFFDPKKIHTPLSFGLKVRDTILTAGADNGAKPKNILSYSSQEGVRILPYSWERFRDTNGDFTLVNLALSEPKEGENDVAYGRTYMCTPHQRGEAWTDTLFVFTFVSTTEKQAQDILFSWGCTKEYTSMLDSGGSSLFGLGKDVYYGYTRKGVPDKRKLPHLISFYEV